MNIFSHHRQDKCIQDFDGTPEEMKSLRRLRRKFQDNIKIIKCIHLPQDSACDNVMDIYLSKSWVNLFTTLRN
jgi:hypothetical protein